MGTGKRLFSTIYSKLSTFKGSSKKAYSDNNDIFARVRERVRLYEI